METKEYKITNEQTIEERYNRYMQQAKQNYPNLKNITIVEYKVLRECFEKGDRTALVELYNKSIKDIVDCVVKFYSKNEIEDCFSFEEAVSYSLMHMQKMIVNFEKLPKYKAQFTESLMAVYLYRKLVQQYELSKMEQQKCEMLPTSDIIWHIDQNDSEEFDFDYVVNDEFKNAVRKLLTCFNVTDQMVLTLRFGLDDDEPKSLKEIAETYGVTRSRVDQVLRRVVRKIGKSELIKNRFQKCYDMYLTEK